MQKQFVGLVASLLLVSVASPTAAHDESKPAGTMIEGEVSAVSADALTLKTPSGVVPVTLPPDVSISVDGEAGTRSAIRAGEHVMAHGSKLPGGGFVARLIMVENTPNPKMPPPKN